MPKFHWEVLHVFHVMQRSVWSVVGSLVITITNFTTECASERIVKIRQYLMKLWQNLVAYFFDHPVYNSTKCKSINKTAYVILCIVFYRVLIMNLLGRFNKVFVYSVRSSDAFIFQNTTMAELKTRVEELRLENDYQLRLKDMTYNEKIKELTEKFIQEMESLKTKNQACAF